MIKRNLNQEEAIRHGDGPCLVLAGPGSGKTYVLTNRVLNLIDVHNVSPEIILVITFTRAAALEMQQRFIGIIKNNKLSISSMPKFGTFHSVFYDVLKNDFGYNSKSLLTTGDEKIFLSEVLENYKIKKLGFDYISNILSDIKHYKLAVEREEKFIPKYLSPRMFRKVLGDYQEKLFNNKKLDFSDMISKCYELLSKDKKTLNFYQKKYQYILIDEFQDINKLQYDLVKLICKSKNLFVVGDDDQSIYKFRGSHPKVMVDFLDDFKKAKVINLNENYRCAKQIVKFSKLVIDNNRERFDKNLVSNRDEFGKLEIKSFVDSTEENKYIIELIKKYFRQGKKLSDMAILYRTNLLSNSIKMSLNRNGINYIVKGEDKNIFEHFAIKDIVSYLRLSLGKVSPSDLLNIANKPLRYISRDSIKYKNTSIDDLLDYYKDKDYILNNIYKLKSDLNTIKKCITPLAIRYIRTNIGYDKYLKEHCRKNDFDYEEVEEILDAFEEEAIHYKNIDEFIEFIDNYKSDNSVKEIDDNSINLMTFHLSKGLEFDTVFIIDSNDGLIPHKKSIKENDLETERRLFYVAMTRAKNNLHIYFTIRRFGKDFKPSRFIVEAIGGRNE